MKEYMTQWNETHDGRVKLQYAYAFLALLALVIAGLASLINQQLGQSILSLAFGLTVIFFANAVGWVLLDAFIFKKFESKTDENQVVAPARKSAKTSTRK